MRPKGTLRVGFMCAGVIASLLLLSASLSADACQGDHGIYTNILCVGDHMTGEGAYIISPDGYWRLYISGGTLSPVYDVYGDDSWEWKGNLVVFTAGWEGAGCLTLRVY